MLVREPVPGLPVDPHWPTAALWLRGEQGEPGADTPLLALLGIPLSQSSPSPNGSHLTPFAFRRHLERFACFAAGVGQPDPVDIDLSQKLRVTDLGNLDIGHLDNVQAQATVQEALQSARLRNIASTADLLIAVGGDDAIMRPFMNGLFADLSRVGLLTIDAHHDVRVGYRNQGPHNGAPIRFMLEDGLLGSNVVQIGISAFGNSAHYRSFCGEHGITVIEASRARREGVASCVERNIAALSQRVETVIVDIDLDVIDVGHGPACPGARPGGLATWEVHEAAFVAGKAPKVQALCLVEVDPTLDPTGSGVDNVCLCFLQAAAGLASRRRSL